MLRKMRFSLVLVQLWLAAFVCPVFGQDNELVFPDDYIGIYKGTMEWYSDAGDYQTIETEFHLLPSDSIPGAFKYVLVYDGAPRNYTLLVKDKEKGLFEVDENNGIVLSARLRFNTLYSFFQLDDSFLSSSFEFLGESMVIEFATTNVTQKVQTGTNTEYDIHAYPIGPVQKAVLKKE